ncbi:MAG: imidazole glycerol phosphate synthase cyclase subunit [Oscillospiraceae bacterium]|nr:imidazole glycerol phosphate synthase cyclase subunit [Oscillospiraceae bacterium]
MNEKKIIPGIDIKNGKVVKSVKFLDTKEVGDDPVAFAKKYCDDGADELAVLDIMASIEGRQTRFDIIRQMREIINIPISVSGGIRNLTDIENALNAGASKVAVSTAAVKDKNLIKEAAVKFGSEKIILTIDTRKSNSGKYTVYINGGIGGEDTGIELIDWIKEAERLGAGELLPTSLDTDGVKGGYDIELYNLICNSVKIPVTASGGCGKLEDFLEIFQKTNVSAALAASVFHYGQFTVKQVKEYLSEKGINVRPVM